MVPVIAGLATFGKGVLMGAGSEVGKQIVQEATKPWNDIEPFVKRCAKEGGIPARIRDMVGNEYLTCILITETDSF